MRLKQRLIVLPDGTDIVTFIEHDGNPPDIGPTLADSPARSSPSAISKTATSPLTPTGPSRPIASTPLAAQPIAQAEGEDDANGGEGFARVDLRDAVLTLEKDDGRFAEAGAEPFEPPRISSWNE